MGRLVAGVEGAQRPSLAPQGAVGTRGTLASEMTETQASFKENTQYKTPRARIIRENQDIIPRKSSIIRS